MSNREDKAHIDCIAIWPELKPVCDKDIKSGTETLNIRE